VSSTTPLLRLAPVSALPRSLPADQGVDPAAVLAFLDAVEADPSIELHGLMVLRHGHVVAEGWWAPHTPERPRLLYSLSKSFTSTAVGFALSEGMFDLDDPVVAHFPEFAADITDAGSRAINEQTRVIAVSVPNIEGIKETAWQTYRVSVDAIEAATGYDFLTNVPVGVQAVLERRIDTQ